MDMQELRKFHGLRTVDVASKVGVADSTVRNWETGRSIPTLNFEQMNSLLDLYSCDFDTLLKSWRETRNSDVEEPVKQ